MTFPITVIGVLACIGMCIFGLPGMAALWVAALFISITHPPAVLTGPRVGGVVTAAHEGEEARVRKHREVAARKGGLLTLSDLWRPCAPFGRGDSAGRFPQWSWVTAVLAGAAAAMTLPATNLDGTSNPLFALVNGVALASVIATYAAGRRNFTTVTPDGGTDPCPGVRVDALVRYAVPRPGPAKGHPFAVMVAVVIAAGVGWLGGGVVLGLLGDVFTRAAASDLPVLSRLSAPSVEPANRVPFAVLAGWGVLTFLLWTRPLLVLPGEGLRDFAIGPWLRKVAARAEWAPRFETLKLTGTPVVSRRKVGPATVDTFRPATGKTIADYLKVAGQLPTMLGDGVTVTVLQIASDQMPGQFHPSEFEIVTWPADEPFDFATAPASTGDPGEDQALLTLATRIALARYADSAQVPRVILDEIVLVSTTEQPAPDGEPDMDPEPEGPTPAQERPAARSEMPRPPAPRAPVGGPPTAPPPGVRPVAPIAPPTPARMDPDDPNSVAAAVFGGPAASVPVHDAGPVTGGPRPVRTLPMEDPYIYGEETAAPTARPRRSVGSALRTGGARFGRGVAAGARSARPVLATVGRSVVAVPTALARRVRRHGASRGGAGSVPAAEGSPVVYRVLLIGGDYPMMKIAHIGALSEGFDAEVLVDDGRLSQQAPAIYVGALSDESVEFIPESGVSQTMLHNIRQESWWMPKWKASIKVTLRPPDWHYAGHLEARLADGTVIKRDGFQVKQGAHPEQFFDAESGLRTALSSAAFCSITAWPGARGSRPGERDPGTLAVWYADQGAPIPMSPDTVVPPPQPSAGRTALGQRRRRPDYTAEQAVLGWLTNRAFEEQRLKRPEVVSVEPVTSPRSPRHIWKIRVRFYGGVTLADVRSKALNLASAYGVPWLRVMPASDGCVLFVGCEPASAILADGEATAATLETLDLEQAFVDASLTGRGGLTPTLLEQSVMPRNQQVRVLDYELPPGLDMKRVRASVETLRTNTNMEFFSPEKGVHGAASMRVLMSREDPMPTRVGFDWRFPFAAQRVAAFATRIDGEYEVWDPKKDPHLMLVGGSGAGKSASVQNILTGLLLAGGRCAWVDAQKKGADFKFAAPWMMATGDSVLDALAVFEAFYAEVQRRVDLNAAHGVGSSRDLPEPPEPWFLFADEWVGLVKYGSRPSRTAETDPDLENARQEAIAVYEAKKRIAYLSDRIAAEARSADVHLVMITQRLVVKELPDECSTIKTNMARIILGKTTYGERMSALRDVDHAPDLGERVPKGRGIWESTEDPGVAVQFWYQDQDEYERGLRAADVPTPGRINLDDYRPKSREGGSKFAVIDEGPDRAPLSSPEPPADDWMAVPLVSGDPMADSAPDGEWGEALDLGFDVDLSAEEDSETTAGANGVGGNDLAGLSMDDLPDESESPDFGDWSLTEADLGEPATPRDDDPRPEPEAAPVGVGWLRSLAAAATALPEDVEDEDEDEEVEADPTPAETPERSTAKPEPARPSRPRRRRPRGPRIVAAPVFDEDDDAYEDVSLDGPPPASPAPERQRTEWPEDEPFGSISSPAYPDGPF